MTDGRSPRLRSLHRRAGRAVFGDRLGLALWLGLLVALWVPWRLGIGAVVTDTNALANTVVAVSQGQLAVTELRYPLDTLGAGAVQQGLHQHDGLLYGRNYGQAVAAVPAVWLLQVVAAVADLRAALAGVWSLLVLAFATQVGRLVGRRSLAGRIGAVLALAAFGWNLAAAAPLDDRLLHAVALQASTLLAAATTAVLVYRLVACFEGRTVGLATGVATGLASPIAFWATVPKRHVLVSLLVVATVLAFALGRRRDAPARWSRALPYGLAGLVAWVSAFEGFVLVVALAAVDLPTARSNGARDLLAVAVALGIGLLPAFATNVAISGDPFRAPRLLRGVRSAGIEYGPDGRATAGASLGEDGVTVSAAEPPADDGAARVTGAAGDAADGTGATGTSAWTDALAAPLQAGGALDRIVGVLRTTVGGALSALTEPDRLWHVFVRSGRVPGVNYEAMGYRIVELTVLESAPLLGALALAPVVAVGRLRRALAGVATRDDPAAGSLGRIRSALGDRTPASLSPARQTDLLAVAVALAFALAYLQRVPLHAQFTVRYLLPVYPLGLYGAARLAPVASALRAAPRPAALGFLAGLVGWTAVVLAPLATGSLAVGEAVQFHALGHLLAAAVLTALVAGRLVAPERVRRPWVASALGATAGITTAFYLLAGLGYFRYGTYAVAIGRRLADLVPIV